MNRGRHIMRGMSDNPPQNGLLLKQALPYINKYRGKCFIFVVSAELIKKQVEEGRSLLGQDWAMCRSLGIHCVIYMDIAVEQDKPLTATGLKKILAQNSQLEHQCKTLICRGAYGLRERPRFVQGNWILARPLGVIEAIDMRLHGMVRNIDGRSMLDLMAADYTLLVSPMTPDKQGVSYLLNKYNAVAELTASLQADKVISYTDQLLPAYRMKAMSYNTAMDTKIKGGKQLKEEIAAMIAYCSNGAKRCHLIPANEENALIKELLTARGYGLMINADSYEELIAPRPHDMEAIKALIEPLEKEGLLRPRSIKQLREKAENFRIIKQDGHIIGCAALSPLTGKKDFVELECVVVKKEHAGKGYGGRMLNSMEKLAAQKSYKKLVVFTTQAMKWFQEKGFKPLRKKILPPEYIQKYCIGRGAKILVKELPATDGNQRLETKT